MLGRDAGELKRALELLREAADKLCSAQELYSHRYYEYLFQELEAVILDAKEELKMEQGGEEATNAQPD